MPTGTALIDRAALAANAASVLGSSGTDVASSQAYLNDAIRTLLNRYPFSWRLAATPVSIATALNQTTPYDVSAGAGGVKCQDLYGIILDTGASDSFPMTEIPLARFQSRWANLAYVSAGKPREYARLSNYQFLAAPKAESSAYTFRVWYSPEFVDLTNFGAQITDVNPRAIEAVYLGLLARMYDHLHEPEMFAAKVAQTEAEIQRIITEDKVEPNLTFEIEGFVAAPARVKGSYWAMPDYRRMP